MPMISSETKKAQGTIDATLLCIILIIDKPIPMQDLLIDQQVLFGVKCILNNGN